MFKKLGYVILCVLLICLFTANFSFASNIGGKMDPGMSPQEVKEAGVKIDFVKEHKGLDVYKIANMRKFVYFDKRNDKLIFVTIIKNNESSGLYFMKFRDEAKTHRADVTDYNEDIHYFYLGNDLGVTFEPKVRENLMRITFLSVKLWDDYAETREDREKFKR